MDSQSGIIARFATARTICAGLELYELVPVRSVGPEFMVINTLVSGCWTAVNGHVPAIYRQGEVSVVRLRSRTVSRDVYTFQSAAYFIRLARCIQEEE